MEHYHLLTTWRIQAPLDAVYAAIHNHSRLDRLVAGRDEGGKACGRRRRRHQQRAALCLARAYRMVFDVRATRIEAQVAIEGAVLDDLEGVGRWCLAHAGAVSTVRYELHVHRTRWWMNLVAPFASTLLII